MCLYRIRISNSTLGMLRVNEAKHSIWANALPEGKAFQI